MRESETEVTVSSRQAKTFWGLLKPKIAIAPAVPSPEKQLASLEAEFQSRLHSNRQMVVCHLRANPGREEEIIAGYLQSPQLLKDADTFGEFLSFWLQEFFQRVDTGPIENLLGYIKTAEPTVLPKDLQKAKKEIFDPLFKLLNGKEEKIFKEVRNLGLFSTSQKIAEAAIISEKPLPPSLAKKYQTYVSQLVKLEAGIIKFEPAVPEPKKPAKAQKAASPATLPPPPAESKSQIEAPSPPEVQHSYFIVLGQNPEKFIPVPDQPTLEDLIKKRKIKRIGSFTANDIWEPLVGLSQMTHIQIMERYGEQVAGGPFKGWYKITLGRQWLILFQIQDKEILFRVGPHEDVYATHRRKPKDSSRRL